MWTRYQGASPFGHAAWMSGEVAAAAPETQRAVGEDPSRLFGWVKWAGMFKLTLHYTWPPADPVGFSTTGIQYPAAAGAGAEVLAAIAGEAGVAGAGVSAVTLGSQSSHLGRYQLRSPSSFI